LESGTQDGSSSAPTDLVRGERLLWKMADVKGLFTRRLVTGYLITNFRCFVWDAEADVVRASVPVSKCEVVVSSLREGVRSRRGGKFLPSMPPPAMAAEPSPEMKPEPITKVTLGDVAFRADGETIMVFREVADPGRVKDLVDGLRALARPSADERVEAVIRARTVRSE
jgi:hypothetical protein